MPASASSDLSTASSPPSSFAAREQTPPTSSSSESKEAAASPSTADSDSASGDEPPKKRISKSELKRAGRLLTYLAPYRKKLYLALGALVLATGFSLAFPWLIGLLLDVAGGKGPESGWLSTLNGVATLILSLLALQAGISFFRIMWFNEVGEKAVAALRRDTYSHLIRLPMAFFNQRRVGELTSRLAADITLIQETLIREVPMVLRQLITATGGLILVLALYFKLALVMLATLPPTIIVAIIIGTQVRKFSRLAQDRLATTNVTVEETLQGIQTVKAFTSEDFETRRYGDGLTDFVTAALQGAKYRAALVSFIIFGLFGAITVVIWFGASLVDQGAMSVGDLTRFVLYTIFIGGALRAFTEFYANLQKTLGATERVQEMLRETQETDQAVASGDVVEHPALQLQGRIEFQNVRFAYPSRPEVTVLEDISFTAKPGLRVALVGPSGAGKSTIINLLLRLFDPDSGQVLVDGQPARSYPLGQLRARMALVPQDVVLFGGSIRENIAYARPGGHATQDEIESAARQANAHDFISAFPDGYETIVGERGIKLSGGQRQRVAIARAILRDPAILVLDEATSSLDAESERLVQDALNTLMRGRTSFVIAHRLSTIRDADLILVIRDGKIAESGTHEALLNNSDAGIYRALLENQLAG